MSRLSRVLLGPFQRLGHAYNETAKRNPLSTGMITTVIKTSAADLFAQKVIEGREEVDFRRHAMFCAFGFAYLGGVQYYLYNDLFVKLCKPITRAFGHVGAAPIKVFIDQALHHPLMYFPAFYMLKGAVEGRALEDTVAKYRTELWDNLKACWMIWVPAQFVNFTLVPLHLRIPFVAGVSFAWTVVISVMRGTLDKSLAAAHPVEAAEPNSNSVFLAHTLELKREEQQQHAASEAAAHGASPAGASVVPVVVAAAQQQKAPVAATHRPVLNAAAAVTVQADAGGGAAIASAAVIRPVRLVSSSPDGLAGLKALAADQAGMGDDAPRTA